jgi:hypothetical protein
MNALKVSPDNVVIISLLSSMEQIHLQIVKSIPCLSAAGFIASNEVLSKASSISRNAPKAISLC